jgi:hypothetical protein
VFVAAFVVFIAPIVAVTAYTTQAPAKPKPVPSAQPGTIKVTGPETVASATPTTSETATQAARHEEAPCMCMPPPPPKATATATATVKTVKHEAPKAQCCAGETEMQCAMRRSVGATCG